MTASSVASVQKRNVGRAAAAEVRNGMIVGLGTGSTVQCVIDALATRVSEGLSIRSVATSSRTAAVAAAAGLDLLDFSTLPVIDLCIDGVDEIDPAFRAIKGAGGAMLREKIVADAAIRMIAVADATKEVAILGNARLPVEILPFAKASVERQLVELGGEPLLRLDRTGAPWLSDQDNIIFDCRFGPIDDPARLAETLSSIPGVLGHGLFLTEIDALLVGGDTGVQIKQRAGRKPPAPSATMIGNHHG